MSEMKTSDEERWRRRDGETEIYRVCVSIIIDRIGRAGKPVLLLARAREYTHDSWPASMTHKQKI